MSDCFHCDQNRRTAIQKSLSKMLRLGRGRRRFSTASCCRSTKFSKTRSRRLRKRRKSAPRQSKSRLNMGQSYNRIQAVGRPLCYSFQSRREFWRGTGRPAGAWEVGVYVSPRNHALVELKECTETGRLTRTGEGN